MFDLTHKESIKKACKAITPVVDIVKLRGCQYFPLRGQRDRPRIFLGSLHNETVKEAYWWNFMKSGISFNEKLS